MRPKVCVATRRRARPRWRLRKKLAAQVRHISFWSPPDAGRSGRGLGLRGNGARLVLKPHLSASRREVRAQDELALETARLETAVCLGDLIEGDPLGDAWPDGASC